MLGSLHLECPSLHRKLEALDSPLLQRYSLDPHLLMAVVAAVVVDAVSHAVQLLLMKQASMGFLLEAERMTEMAVGHLLYLVV